MKRCSKCELELPLENFNKYKNSKDGLQSRCRACSAASVKEHYIENKEKYTKNRMLWRHKNKDNETRDRITRAKWRDKNPEAVRAMARNRHKKLRRKTLEKIGPLICNCCGCDKYEFLEINHINGNGNKERKQTGVFYLDVIHGRRNVDDLEILCRPCNHVHYLELKYGKLPYRVIWNE